MSEAGFLAARDVSRETMERLKTYESLLRKWNPAINLVAKSTVDDLWARHFEDSAQIYDLAPESAGKWADLGSGGGFPGLVAAILAAGDGRTTAFTLVESDLRKAAFLSTVARETGLQVRVMPDRAEVLPPLGADVVSARALAPLEKLISFAARHLGPAGTALFAKGANHAAELAKALESWRFSYQAVASRTEPDAVIYKIEGISRV